MVTNDFYCYQVMDNIFGVIWHFTLCENARRGKMDKSGKTIRVEKNIYLRGPNTYQVKMRDGLRGWFTQSFFDPKSDSAALQKARDFKELKRISKSNDDDFKRIEGSSLNKRISTTTFGDLLNQYKKEITPTKKDTRTECLRIDMLLRLPIATLPANRIDGEVVRKQLLKMTYRNEGKKPISDSTKVRYQALISHVYKTARTVWRHKLLNPVEDMQKFTNGQGRDRRLLTGEYDYLIRNLTSNTRAANKELKLIFMLALGTGMREDEILTTKWEDVDWTHHSITVTRDRAKNGRERAVPIFKEDAIQELSTLHSKLNKPKHGSVFATSQGGLIQAFKKAVVRARDAYERDCIKEEKKPNENFLVNLTFHDLRHEAASFLFENSELRDLEIMQILGHQDLQTTKRYAHLKSKQLGKKIIDFKKPTE